MSSSTPAAPAAPAQRLVSLDALRGFDMFWILGADALVYALAKVCDIPPFRLLAGQLEHKDWAGFAFYDLIFPLFVFMAGVSVVFSLQRQLAAGGRTAALKRVLWRGGLLFLLGLFYAGGVSTKWPDIRVLGVLQRIALAYTGAGLLFCFFKPRALAGIFASLLIGYWALLSFVPIRDVTLERNAVPAKLGVAKPTAEQVRALYDGTTTKVTGAYEAGRNLTNHLDYEYLGGRKYDLYWDPEGMLSTMTAVGSCLLGVFAGLLLRRADWDDRKKVAWLAGAGALAVALGFLWGLQFPVVKKIWTSSFVLVAGGYSALLLAAFYYLIDIRGWRRWCVPFVWIGMNPITLYLISGIVGYRRLAARLAGGDVQSWFDSALGNGWGNLGIAVVGLALMLLLARFLYQRQIFLRV
jgi:predicted acyltransferase